MSYIVPKDIPNCCGRCPCFHAEHPMYCQAVKADKNKRIYAPYGDGRPDWCPLIEVPTPHGRLIDADAVNRKMDERIETLKDDASIYEASCVATALEMFAPTVIEAEE